MRSISFLLQLITCFLSIQNGFQNPNHQFFNKLENDILASSEIIPRNNSDVFLTNFDNLTFLKSESIHENSDYQHQNRFLSPNSTSGINRTTIFFNNNTLNILLLMMIGSLAMFVLIYLYRSIFYAIFFKRIYRYPEFEKVKPYEKYVKKIYLLENELQLAGILWQNMNNKKNLVQNWIDDPESIKVQLKNEIKKLGQNAKKQAFYYDIEPGSRLFEIIEAFFTYEALKLYPSTKRMFEKIKCKYEKKYMKSWYKQFVDLEISQKSTSIFPQFKLKEGILEEEISKFHSKYRKNIKVLPENEKIKNSEINLLKKIIIIQAIGIPSGPLKWYHIFEYSNGESLLKNSAKIAYIQYEMFPFDLKTPNDRIWKFPICKYYNQIPRWLDFKIINGTLYFYGTPKERDIGIYHINIFDNKGIIYRQFSIEVVSDGIESKKSNFSSQNVSLSSELNFFSKEKSSSITFNDEDLSSTGYQSKFLKMEKGKRNDFAKNLTYDEESPPLTAEKEEIFHENNKFEKIGNFDDIGVSDSQTVETNGALKNIKNAFFFILNRLENEHEGYFSQEFKEKDNEKLEKKIKVYDVRLPSIREENINEAFVVDKEKIQKEEKQSDFKLNVSSNKTEFVNEEIIFEGGILEKSKKLTPKTPEEESMDTDREWLFGFDEQIWTETKTDNNNSPSIQQDFQNSQIVGNPNINENEEEKKIEIIENKDIETKISENLNLNEEPSKEKNTIKKEEDKDRKKSVRKSFFGKKENTSKKIQTQIMKVQEKKPVKAKAKKGEKVKKFDEEISKPKIIENLKEFTDIILSNVNQNNRNITKASDNPKNIPDGNFKKQEEGQSPTNIIYKTNTDKIEKQPSFDEIILPNSKKVNDNKTDFLTKIQENASEEKIHIESPKRLKTNFIMNLQNDDEKETNAEENSLWNYRKISRLSLSSTLENNLTNKKEILKKLNARRKTTLIQTINENEILENLEKKNSLEEIILPEK